MTQAGAKSWKGNGHSRSIMDFINETIEADAQKITKSEFKYIRNNGTSAELEEAVAKMEAAGGYDNLDD